MAGEELGGGTEVGGADGGQSHRGLHPGAGDLRSSAEAVGADGAGRQAEDGEGGHCEERTTFGPGGNNGEGRGMDGDGKGGEKCSRILRVVWCWRLRQLHGC